MTYYYIRGKRAYPTNDVIKWATEIEKSKKDGSFRVGDTRIEDVNVSTVFLGLDHSFTPNPKVPIIYETMIFGGPRDGDTYRYSTWRQAKKGHDKLVKELEMGMYDRIFCKKELLPLEEDEKQFVDFDTEFQTKSLDRTLKDYYISEEGLFYNLEQVLFTGTVLFYTDIDELDGRWLEFNAKFFDGELQEVIRV